MLEEFHLHYENDDYLNRSYSCEEDLVEQLANKDQIDFLFDLEINEIDFKDY